MINSLKQLFRTEIRPKTTIPVAEGDLRPFITGNRASLGQIDNWIDEKAFASSYFNYGVPDFIRDKINKPINTTPTYTDLMAYIASKYFQSVNYLEIGVSVGKNFYQMQQSLENAELTGFDIEEINPVLEKGLERISKTEWDTPPGSIKKNRSSLTTYHAGNKNIRYLSADVWDENSWAKLEGSKFNLVFSDALHTPEAILFEFEMLVKYQLLDEKFVIVWDDLVGKMKKSFYRIIRKYHKAYNLQEINLMSINGWIGEYENAHSVGLISNFKF